MPSASQSTLIQVFRILKSLRKIISTPQQIEETYVREFHNALNMLESLGQNVKDFYIPDSEMKPRLIAIKSSGQRSYSHEKYVSSELLLSKLDDLLFSFNIDYADEKVVVSFDKS